MSSAERSNGDHFVQVDANVSMRPEGLESALRSITAQLSALHRRTGRHPIDVSETKELEDAPIPEEPRISYLHGLDAIRSAIDEALNGAHREILTAQPDGPRPGPVLDTALESVRRHIEAGVAMRTLYQHTTRFDEATKNYVRAVTNYGVRIRTLAEFFDRLIIVDDSVAFISANESRTTGLAIREPAIVRFLKDTFERSWDRAKSFPFVPLHAAKAADDVIPSLRESISRLLISGYSDKRIARRLGISERSLQGHIATMKQQLGAHTRLQLGYLLGRDETTLVL
ncbi:LuxR C-terminal-related transcriptional regulator [Streptomyces halobius]|uniref:LuxR C-terminal-related transcriptional regulator n=1 Tax=Streptomyces halobius TaxID=2879846 RepID=A0ABY4M5N9_9ACTN|nr:LuxR C-terminal-related transcriptional regulator [Streptomyces halobius]UQA92144.1 LuxR C-terminal-related transcriptional regulator [Streptomyces halobius]